ncbi:MAG: alpha/beta hydrolase fold domain-containing protein [Alphaproteobacteria bacterium]|nr:alpha/beta hydrolase fold domain-containing protein [Alphaproteobacteria bacterium]
MSLQATIARTLLKLPGSWLVRLSGGKPVEIGGRRLDPHFQFLAHGAQKQPPMSSLSAQEGRAASAAGLAMFAAKPEPAVGWEDFTIPGPAAEIPVRLYRPEAQDPSAPMMVFCHFGGGVIGDLETCHAFCTMLAGIVRAPVLSVDYRLAPEHPWPAGLEDCEAAYEWALKHAGEYGAPAGEAAIGGDSMGGNFAAIIAQEARRQARPKPRLQLLIYPATDVSRAFPSRETYGETYPLSSETMDWFMGHYIPEGADRADPRISPGQEMDLSDLPPAIIATAGFDPLVDEGEDYARRLEAAGVATVYKCYDSLAHGFTAFTGAAPAADAACREIAGLVARVCKQTSEAPAT